MNSLESDKDFIGMSNCFICGETKELLLDRRLKKTIPRNAVYNKEPCDRCKEVMEKGVFLIGVKDNQEESERENPYRTGQILALKDEAIKNLFNGEMLQDILLKRVCYVEESVLKRMGLVKKDGSLKFKK